MRHQSAQPERDGCGFFGLPTHPRSSDASEETGERRKRKPYSNRRVRGTLLLRCNLKKESLRGLRVIICSQINHESNWAKIPPRPRETIIILEMIVQFSPLSLSTLFRGVHPACACVCLSGRLGVNTLFPRWRSHHSRRRFVFLQKGSKCVRCC